jgi:hypothetical protein
MVQPLISKSDTTYFAVLSKKNQRKSSGLPADGLNGVACAASQQGGQNAAAAGPAAH